MPDIVYLILMCLVLVFVNLHEIYLFKKGKYWPYLCGRKGIRDKIYGVVSVIVIIGCLNNLAINAMVTIILIMLVLASAMSSSILNFLSYLKVKDRKIIYQTLVFDIAVIALVVFMQSTLA
ncbi:hypothetical protein [Desulfosporosinus hippei]|uniref:DUF4181 domain-containing protein n=1 Tax=Desulfosporosinus hippei DSM 8344 TaxID=1121419 RepID=A0A1G7V4H9_9FIRM|nr:hypothetical protein [Desulfosporosinus hippei]SDG54673.1 hypothetical protein SAMN05443529_1044 [Desulfosporosinus hippei DSM 8344]